MATKLKTDVCKGCGRPIVWARVMKRNTSTGALEVGAPCPMDPRPPVYRVSELNGQVVAFRVNGDDRLDNNDPGTYLVSHFSTCTKANDFSGGGRRA